MRGSEASSSASYDRETSQRFRNEWTQKSVVEDNLITTMVEYNVQVEPRN